MKKVITVLLPIIVLTGCISPKTYVNPNFGKTSYNDIKSVANRYNAEVQVEFQRNGKSLPAVNDEVRNHVERTLRATGVIVPSLDESAYSIKVTVNNIADMSDAAAKGFGTGLTFGAVGTTVVDYYEVEIVYTDNKGNNLSKNYKHALHTTIGNEDAPFMNVAPTTTADAFGTVVEEVLLNFIADMQRDGKLTKINTFSISIRNS
jgi:uncharacterized lipoprotein YajG